MLLAGLTMLLAEFTRLLARSIMFLRWLTALFADALPLFFNNTCFTFIKAAARIVSLQLIFAK